MVTQPSTLFVLRHRSMLALTLLLAFLVGCSSAPPPAPAGEPEEIPLRNDLSIDEAYDLWESVLKRFVNSYGGINFPELKEDRQDLDAFLGWLRSTSPAKHPKRFRSREAHLAYHLNAYNAAAMARVLDTGVPSRLDSVLKRYRFFYRNATYIGDKRVSLSDYEKKIMRDLGDERVHFALNAMLLGSPRLQRKAFRPYTVMDQLTEAARLFMSEPRNIYIDDESRTVYLSEIFKFYRSDFKAKAPNLIAYTNIYRIQNSPENYRVRFIDFDWAISYGK